ncbi:TonB-dependent receptor [Carboxylicivirga sp. M1479]|uniref:SusC/RagA family TonB-linked outer membrane protein n=1 Tax=Carboxylicivirga sp. M1479 TaxID=2594476 RepID=UPI00117852F5|nr:TonB-dependent receptor [Carboxylicivirga sp. M1479]TRX71134.1 TonB-dependent receptor [Carboxylicivirga sp. M1479]
MKKVLCALSLMVMLGLQSLIAQTTSLTGIVTDASDGSPIPGVSVFVKGTTVGTITMPDGAYNLEVPADATTLVFSFVGMTMQEIVIDGKTTINAVMQGDAIDVGEVMVVAYGTAKKESFTGSASVVGGEQIAKMQTSSVSKALEGTTSGVQVVSSSGQPGSDAAIRIRGVGSINASSSPLYVVDGVPYDGKLNAINPQDIESLTVLKDAASAALYGSRGANGVIMITTKKGKKGETRVSFDARVGVNSRAVPAYDVYTDPGQYFGKAWEAYRNGFYAGDEYTLEEAGVEASNDLINRLGGYNPYRGVDDTQVVMPDGTVTSASYLYNDNWEDETFNNGKRQEYNLNISGGSEKTTHYISLGYLNDEGIIRGSSFERFSLRSNLDYQITEHIKIGSNLSYARGEQDAPKTSSGNSFSNPFMFTQNVAPIYPVYIYDADGNKQYSPTGEVMYDFGDKTMEGTSGRVYGARQNPAAMSAYDLNNRVEDSFSNRTYLSVDFLQHFNITANMAYDLRNLNRSVFYSPLNGDAVNVNGRSQKWGNRYQTTTINQLLKYNQSFGQHSISALVGHESYNYEMKQLYGEKTNFFIPDNHEFNNGVNMVGLTSYANRHTIESFLSQVNYDFKDRYYFSASFRTDGSSKFHDNNRWGNFWSVGGSWRVSEEEFMSQVTWVDNLKLKGSYGVQGNDGILDTNSNTVYYPYKDMYDVVNNNGEVSLSLAYKGNKDLSWEVSKNLNVGVELTALHNRLRFEFEYFNRATSDLLFNNPQPTSSGIAYIPENIADMKNEGIDFNVAYDIVRNNNFTWNMALFGTHYKNEITSLPADKVENGIVMGNKILTVGGSIYDFYLNQWAGVDPETGSALYWMNSVDEEGNEVKVKTDSYEQVSSSDSREISGSSLPDFQGSWNNTFTYKSIDLSVVTNFQFGGQVYDGNYAGLMHAGRLGTNWHTDINNAWTPDNPNTDVPRLEENYQDANQQSDRFLIDASYFNIRNITLGYTFPAQLLNDLHVKSLRVYFAADNVLLFSKRSGMDPRQYFSGSNTSFNYAPIRTVSFGLNVNF